MRFGITPLSSHVTPSHVTGNTPQDRSYSRAFFEGKKVKDVTYYKAFGHEGAHRVCTRDAPWGPCLPRASAQGTQQEWRGAFCPPPPAPGSCAMALGGLTGLVKDRNAGRRNADGRASGRRFCQVALPHTCTQQPQPQGEEGAPFGDPSHLRPLCETLGGPGGLG